MIDMLRGDAHRGHDTLNGRTRAGHAPARRRFAGQLAGLALAAALAPARARVPSARLEPLLHHSDATLAWLLQRLQDDGSFGADVDELTSYFKPANLFTIAGRLTEANRVLTHLERRYMQPNGDFMMSAEDKSAKIDYYEKVWPYANGWIAFTAHKAGRFDISYPAMRFLRGFHHPRTGGFTSTPPSVEPPEIDLLATTHLGLVSLYLGERAMAASAAGLVRRFITAQPDIDRGLLIRMDARGAFIEDWPQSDAPYYFLDARAPEQFYFLAGFPIAFLGKMYRATGETAHLDAARAYFDFARDCEGIGASHFAHKVGWGASVLYNLTGEQPYADFALRVAQYLIGIQDEAGAWFAGEAPAVSYDQSAECAIWLRQIAAELGSA